VVRVGQAMPEMAPSPTRPSVLEKSIRGCKEKLGNNVLDPFLGTIFYSLNEADDFYNLYSWEHGFNIIYGKSRA
jgi:hypothetical protein